MLDAIYGGAYQGIDIAPPDSKEFKDAMEKFEAICMKFQERLKTEELELLDELLSYKNILQAEESREYYIQGFSAGAMLMVDVFQQCQRLAK